MKNKIDFKQKKYTLPLIFLPFLLMLVYIGSTFSEEMEMADKKTEKSNLAQSEEISTNLGGNVDAPIKSKEAAYKDFYDQRDADGRTMINEFEKEQDSLLKFGDNLTDDQKRYIDSLEFERKMAARNAQRTSNRPNNFYDGKSSKPVDEDYEKTMKMLELLNGSKTKEEVQPRVEKQPERNPQQEQLTLMREQMLLIDSLEKSNDPEFRKRHLANEELIKNEALYDYYKNSSLGVRKTDNNSQFNSVHKEHQGEFIKAIIDENIKGYMGSRLRIRLLEDVYVGNYKLPKNTNLYALISGFTLQRVKLEIVSVMHNNQILPINLTIYDVDGMEGLYVPASAFREMTKTMGSTVVQGQNINSTGGGFAQTALTSLFQSTSRTIAELIRKNKVKIKYNSFVYLIDKSQIEEKRKAIYEKNKK